VSQSEKGDALHLCRMMNRYAIQSALPLVFISLPNYRRGLILHCIFSSESLCKVHKKFIVSEVLEYDRMILILMRLPMWIVPGKRIAFMAIAQLWMSCFLNAAMLS